MASVMLLEEKLSIYRSLLLKWQKTINLVAPSTIHDLDQRHFEDSLGFLDYIQPKASDHIVDLGSGGGFPALVLAMALPECQFSLIESDERKSIFLEIVSRETNCSNVTIYNDRIENALPQIEPIDLITARALAPLPDLINMVEMAKFKNDKRALFAKGQKAHEEIEEALQHHHYKITCHENRKNIGSYIVELCA